MKRLEAIDQFRGFAILLMILANYMNNVSLIPSWLKHSDDIGYTVIDLIAPPPTKLPSTENKAISVCRNGSGEVL